MNTIRYVAALLLVVSAPPAIILWFLIHPLAPFWRRWGPGWTYAILGLPMLGLMAGTVLARDWILAVDYGTSAPLVVVAVLLFLCSFRVALKRKKQLTFGILAGIPELSKEKYPGRLLTEGIYARVRHPRYVETALGMTAYAVFANYLGGYLVVGAGLVALYLIVLLEERELRARFGEEYERYARVVPRFIPRRSGPC